MLKIKNALNPILTFVAVLLIVLLTALSDVCKKGAGRGLLICGNVIIPSLFPFMVCVLIIMKTENDLLFKIMPANLKQNAVILKIFFLSVLGGYPVGSKLINELYIQNKIDIKTANTMQLYCVNAGPAFIISAVGNGVFNSTVIGIILFISHITSSVLIAVFTLKFTKVNFCDYKMSENRIGFSEKFILSTSEAASSVMGICVYVIFFSVINEYIEYFGKNFPILKNAVYFTEVTSGITHTKNVIFVSFLLGFAGISIWFQIFSISNRAKLNFKLFAAGRLLHGGLSSILTYTALKIFKITIPAVSNNLLNGTKFFYKDFSLAISLAVMLIVFLIYLYSKNYSGKIIDDVL